MEQELLEKNDYGQHGGRSIDENFEPQKIAEENIRLHRETSGGAAGTRRQERSEAYPEHSERPSRNDEGRPQDVNVEKQKPSADEDQVRGSEGNERHRPHTGG